jgi:hypothetical protein
LPWQDVRWGQARSAALGLISNSLGVVVGSSLLVVPEPTMGTKIVGVIVLGKSVAGWGLSWYNFTQAFTQPTNRFDAPSSATRAVAAMTAPGNKDALLAADAADLTIDLLAGRGSVYAYGKPTIKGAKGVKKSFDPVKRTFTNPGPIKSFQSLQTSERIINDAKITKKRYN